MARIARRLTDLIGNTPLLELTNYEREKGLEARLLAKLEYFNPLGSAKDRVAEAMLVQGLKEGKINSNTVIIEPTSGNTGIGLALAAAVRGLRLILTMPETMSVERTKILTALGAEVVLTEGSKGMQGAIEMAERLVLEYGNAFVPKQFENPANPAIHRRTTAEEIWRDTDGKVDIFVSAIGTGGTITGVGEGLKEKNPTVWVAGAEPAGSPVLSGGRAGIHKIQGIGAGFVPKILNRAVIDEILTVEDEEAFAAVRAAAKADGVFVGISSGAALCAAERLAKRPENKGKNIVVFFPDGGERYLSTDLFV